MALKRADDLIAYVAHASIEFDLMPTPTYSDSQRATPCAAASIATWSKRRESLLTGAPRHQHRREHATAYFALAATISQRHIYDRNNNTLRLSAIIGLVFSIIPTSRAAIAHEDTIAPPSARISRRSTFMRAIAFLSLFAFVDVALVRCATAHGRFRS